MEELEIALIGLVLLAFTLVSRRLDASPITMPIVFVTAGAGAAEIGLVEVAAELAAIALLAEVTLAVILFSDSTRISLPRLRSHLGVPSRLLGIGLPLTVLAGLGINLLIFPDLPFAQGLLLAAMLAPTDAALGSAVVSDPSVPSEDRLALNVESGLNDGMVVPVVAVATSIIIDMQRTTAAWVGFVVQQVVVGAAVGVALGLVGITVLRRARAAGWSDARYEQIATFALPIIALTLASAFSGNGFIAAFVAGLAFGTGGVRPSSDRNMDRDIDDEMEGAEEAEHLASFTEDAAELLAAFTFFVFGNLFVADAIEQFDVRVLIASIASLTIVRMLPVFLALTGSTCDVIGKLFIGWFGPRGLASIVFLILLLEEFEGAEAPRRIVGVVALTVCLSVLLHGATAAIGARRYGRHVEQTRRRVTDAELDEMMPRTRWSPRRQA